MLLLRCFIFGWFLSGWVMLTAYSASAQDLIPPPPGSPPGVRYCRDQELCRSYAEIFFGSPTAGYVWGGNLFRTQDGGDTWVPVVGPRAERPMRVAKFFFVDNSTFFVYGSEFLRTVDGGTTFTKISLQLPSVLEPGTMAAVSEKFFFLNAMQGWALSETGMVTTTDGGTTWSFLRRAPSELQSPVRGIWMFDEMAGIIATKQQVARTEDGWRSWRMVADVPETNYLKCARDGFCVGRGSRDEIAYISADGGQTWRQTATSVDPERDQIVDFRVFGADNAVLVGSHNDEPVSAHEELVGTGTPIPEPPPDRGLMLRWRGTSWERTEYPELQTLWTVHFVDDNEVWGSADNNGLIRSSDGGQTWTFVPDYYHQIAALTPSPTPFAFPTPAPTP